MLIAHRLPDLNDDYETDSRYQLGLQAGSSMAWIAVDGSVGKIHPDLDITLRLNTQTTTVTATGRQQLKQNSTQAAECEQSTRCE